MRWLLFLGALVWVSLASGALAKPAAPQVDIRDFKVGLATAQDVETRLGPPSTQTQTSDGTVVLIYVVARDHVKAATFIPYVGLFAGGTRFQATTMTFTFGSDGLLKSAMSSASNYDCSGNITGPSCKPAGAK